MGQIYDRYFGDSKTSSVRSYLMLTLSTSLFVVGILFTVLLISWCLQRYNTIGSLAFSSLDWLRLIGGGIICMLFICVGLFRSFETAPSPSILPNAPTRPPGSIAAELGLPTPTLPTNESLDVRETDASSYSSWLSSQPPSGAVDGNTANEATALWLSKRDDVERAWFAVTFTEPRTVTSVDVFIVTDEPWGGQISHAQMLFDDGTTQEITVPFLPGWQHLDITPTHTQSIRFNILSRVPELPQIEIREIRFWGTRLS